ncbi:hypothetical protein J3B02_004082 [Coemansia erecta]|uniref:Uncharacterized protein n=1 Tax=Coemansia asiatica TaxID=1052880 RepID=A0A9W7XN42_9FUNG|nr:hypothetical protein LPJ64_001665 [Coemansia asiatica]KAJ2847814.1 hypothetical protein J3B02_004082 [Coemansia erecta]KAJ2882053.1 hypothetical protein FB639_002474 [Coemansia asiatica]
MTDQHEPSSDEFVKTYIAQLKTKLAANPVKPDATADISLLKMDAEAPKDRRRFYTAKQIEEIAMEECAECEYAWRKCSIDPPTIFDKFLGCRRLRQQYYMCMDKAREEVKKRSGKEPLFASSK